MPRKLAWLGVAEPAADAHKGRYCLPIGQTERAMRRSGSAIACLGGKPEC